MSNRTVWAVCVLLAGVVLVGIGRMLVRLPPYYVAKYHGRAADLHGAVLLWAPLRNADLRGADLRDADLRGADLRDAYLAGATLTGANLKGATLTHARYDSLTRWPKGFDPHQHGAAKQLW